MNAGCYHVPEDPAHANRYGRRVQERWTQRVVVTEETLFDDQ